MKTVLTVALLFALPLLASEDPKLRQEANELAQRSRPASTPAMWPPHRQVTEFRYTDVDGKITEGVLDLAYQAPYVLRTEISFGDYHSLNVEGPGVSGGKKNAPLAPPGVREMSQLIRYLILFDKE